MYWYEVIEDLGDGSSAVRRFSNNSAAQKYFVENEEYCFCGVNRVDTDDGFFWYDGDDDAL